MKAAWLGSLKIHDVADSTVKFQLNHGVQGLERPTTRSTVIPKAGENGIYLTNIYYDERRVTLPGLVEGSSYSDLITQRRLLQSACDLSKNTRDLPSDIVFRFTGMDDVDYRITGQVIDLRMPYGNPGHSDFTIDFLATNHVVESYSSVTITVNTASDSGAVMPWTMPVTLGTTISGSEMIVNNGDAPAFPVITLHGPLTSPRIRNDSTGLSVALNMTINAGAYVTIDMLNRTIVQGGVTNRMSKKTSDSKFWYLDSGNNTVSLLSTVSSEAGYAEVEYRHSYWGY